VKASYKWARSLRLIACASASTAAVSLIAACGSSGAAPGSGAAKSLPPVVLGLDNEPPTPIVSDSIIALQNGYFKKYGLNVTIKAMGAVSLTEAAAGRIDLANSGVVGSLPAAIQGHQTSIIYEQTSSIADGNLVVKANSPYHSLMDLSGKKVVVAGAGGGLYGAAEGYSHYIVAHGGKPLTIVITNSTGSENSELLSGQVDAAVAVLDNSAIDIHAGQERILLESSSKQGQAILKAAVGAGFWGLASDLSAKKASVTAFIAGLRKADLWMRSHTPQQVANVLIKSPLYSGETIADIEEGATYDKSLYAPTNGFVSSEDWQDSLSAYASWNVPNLNLSSSAVTYGSVVNMSYWNGATKLIQGS
jgi:ABC-type nitrate/sulfonate/bicarbonate transport system substrate-binding protein